MSGQPDLISGRQSGPAFVDQSHLRNIINRHFLLSLHLSFRWLVDSEESLLPEAVLTSESPSLATKEPVNPA